MASIAASSKVAGAAFLDATASLLRIETLLRLVWSKELYLDGGAEQAPRDDLHSVHLDVADSAILSGRFLAYCVAVDACGEVLDGLSTWAEGCICHTKFPVLRGYVRHIHEEGDEQANRGQTKKDRCPLRTMQAPALAAGAHFVLLRCLLGMGQNHLVLDPHVAGLCNEDRSLILRVFAAFRRHLIFGFNIKLSMWRQLPWLLCGLAHPDHEVVVQVAVRILQIYAALDPAAVLHDLARTCMPGTVGHAQLHLLATRQEVLRRLPFLCTLASRLRFVPVTERWVEMLHSLTKRWLALAPHSGAVQVAFHGIKERIRTLLSEDPANLGNLARHCSSVTSISKALQQVGLWHHPEVRRLQQGQPQLRLLNKMHFPGLVAILYHCDAASLHGPLPGAHDSDSDEDGGNGGGGDDDDDRRGPGIGCRVAGAAGGQPGPASARGGSGGSGPGGGGCGSSGSHGDVGETSVGPAPGGSGSRHIQGGAGGDGGSNGGVKRGAGDLLQVDGKEDHSLDLTRFAGHGLHDELLCCHAIRHLRLLSNELVEAEQLPLTISLGPMLGQHASVYTQLLADVTNPDPSQLDGSGKSCEFQFEAEQLPDKFEIVESEDERVQHDDGLANVHFFTIFNSSPSRKHVLPGIPTVTGNDVLCVSRLHVHEFRRDDKFVSTCLEGVGGTGEADLELLCARHLSVADLATVKRWDVAEQVQYSFGFTEHSDIRESLQHVTSELLSASARPDSARQEYWVFDQDDPDQHRLQALHALESRGYVARLSEDAKCSSWRLTPSGRAKLRCVNVLKNPRPALDKRDNVGLMDMTQWELARCLQEEGFVCTGKVAKKALKAIAQPKLDYPSLVS